MGDFNTASFYGDEATDLRGPQGDQGEPGAQGNPGPRGEPGKDAYQVWLALGNAGTEADFIAALRGPAGNSGAPGKNATYRYGSFAGTGIQAEELLMDHAVIQAHSLPPNFAGSALSCGTPPKADWTATVMLNSSVIGTFSFAAGSTTGTLATTFNTTTPVAAGDIVSVIAPPDADPEIRRLRFTFNGVL